MDWVKAFKNAAGPRRYVIGGAITLAVSLFDLLKPRLAGLGMTELVGIPSWAVAIIVALGFVAYWFLQRLVQLEAQINGARTALAHLRSSGVVLRNQGRGGFRDEAEFSTWQARATTWNSQVIEAIRRFNAADAEWFSVLDVVPEPRLLALSPLWNEDTYLAYAMHDFRVHRLGDLIEKTRAPANA